MTRATGDLHLVAPGKDQSRNQGTDGEIERTHAQINAARRLLSSASDDFGRQRDLEAKEEGTREGLASAEEESRHARADRDQIEAYRECAKAMDAARTAYGELSAALTAYDAAVAEAEAADAEAAAAQTGQRAADASAANSRWDRLASLEGGADPVAWTVRVRSAAARWQEAVERLHDLERARAESMERRDSLSAVAVLPEEVQEQLARLPESIEALEQKAALAEESAESRRALAVEALRKRADFQRRYAPIEGMDVERIVTLLEERAALHKKIASIDSDTAGAREIVTGAAGKRRWPRALVIGAVAGAALGVGLIALNAPTAVGVAAGAIVLAILFLLLRRTPRAVRNAQKALETATREADAARARLQMEILPPGPWLPDDEGAADRARELYRNREADAASLAETEALADEPALDRAARTREEAHAERQRLEEQASLIEQASGRPASEGNSRLSGSGHGIASH